VSAQELQEQADWLADSDQVFEAITTSGFETIEEAKQCLVVMYMPDLSFSRAGISHALKRLEAHYRDKG
jgi:hypothetical protein